MQETCRSADCRVLLHQYLRREERRTDRRAVLPSAVIPPAEGLLYPGIKAYVLGMSTSLDVDPKPTAWKPLRTLNADHPEQVELVRIGAACCRRVDHDTQVGVGGGEHVAVEGDGPDDR